MYSSLSNSLTSLNERSSTSVDEVTDSLGSCTLADTRSRDEVAIHNIVEHHNVENISMVNYGTEIIDKQVGGEAETEEQLPAAADDDKTFLREQLNLLECPFTWKVQNENVQETPDAIIARINEKLEEIKEDSTFQWRNFILTLVTCYEHFRKGDISVSWDKYRTCETILHPSGSKGTYENFFQATKEALLHVIYSCKCHLSFETGVLSETRRTLQKVCKFEEMDNLCKAAIWGIRASISLEYGYEGTKVMYYINI
jgi:hypothetical protein